MLQCTLGNDSLPRTSAINLPICTCPDRPHVSVDRQGQRRPIPFLEANYRDLHPSRHMTCKPQITHLDHLRVALDSLNIMSDGSATWPDSPVHPDCAESWLPSQVFSKLVFSCFQHLDTIHQSQNNVLSLRNIPLYLICTLPTIWYSLTLKHSCWTLNHQNTQKCPKGTFPFQSPPFW